MRIAEVMPFYKKDILEKFEKLDSSVRYCTKIAQKEKMAPIVKDILEYSQKISVNQLIACMNKKDIQAIDLTPKEILCTENFYKFLDENNIVDSYWEIYDYLLEDDIVENDLKINILEKYTLDKLLPELLNSLENI